MKTMDFLPFALFFLIFHVILILSVRENEPDFYPRTHVLLTRKLWSQQQEHKPLINTYNIHVDRATAPSMLQQCFYQSSQ